MVLVLSCVTLPVAWLTVPLPPPRFTHLTAAQEKHERRVQQLKQSLELRRKVEIHEIEERKNLHINDLLRNHEEAFGEIKKYYNDITRDNLKIIRRLKVWLSHTQPRQRGQQL